MRSTDIKAVKCMHVACQNVRVKLKKYVFPPERQLHFIIPSSHGFPLCRREGRFPLVPVSLIGGNSWLLYNHFDAFFLFLVNPD